MDKNKANESDGNTEGLLWATDDVGDVKDYVPCLVASMKE
jgi:hypothetical protein